MLYLQPPRGKIIIKMDENTSPIISFREADISNGETVVIYGLNMDVYPGDILYIVGKVGTGKTCIVRTITAENRPAAGSCEVFGEKIESIRNSHIPDLRKKIGIVFQDFQLLMDKDVKENLEFVLRSTGWKDRDAMNERIREVLEMVGMEDKGHKRPYQLSGGQKQRICIARAILNSPSLIVADEPTANLDDDTAAGIVELLRKINSDGTAIVMVTHRNRIIDDMPGRVYLCEDETAREIER